MAISHVFICKRCRSEAGRLTLYARGEPIPAHTDNEYGRLLPDLENAHTARVRLITVSGLVDVAFSEFKLEAVIAAIGMGDARALYTLQPESVPFWCPVCPASYCADDWETWDVFDDGFFDEKRGRCPKGHERRIVD